MIWKSDTLGNCAKFIDYRGKTPQKQDFGITLLTAKNVKMGYLKRDPQEFISEQSYDERMTRGLPEFGDILITTEAPLGNVAQLDINHKVALGQRIITLQFDTSKFDKRFCLYSLMSPNFQRELQRNGTGATVKGIKASLLKKIAFRYPPLTEQQRIVAKLDAAFVEIDVALKANDCNIVNAAKLFEEYRNNIYENLMKSSKLTKVKEIANLSRGHNPPKSSFINEPRDGYVRFYQIRDAKSDKFATYVPHSEKLHLVSEREFLMNAYRHIGEVFRGVNGAFNVALCKLAIKDFNTVCEDYLYNMIPSNLIKGELLKLSERSLIPSMSVKELAELVVPLPSFKQQENVARTIEDVKLQTRALNSIYQQKNTHLENLKLAMLAHELQSDAA